MSEAEWNKMNTELYFITELHLPFKKITKGFYKSIFVRNNKIHLLNKWDEYIETSKHFAKNSNTFLGCKAIQLLSSTRHMFYPLGFIPTQRQLHDDQVDDIRQQLILNIIREKYNGLTSLFHYQIMMPILNEEERLSKIAGSTALINKLTETRRSIKKLFDSLRQSIVDAHADLSKVSKIQYQTKKIELFVKVRSILSVLSTDNDCIKRQPWQWFFFKNKTQRMLQSCFNFINRLIPRQLNIPKQNKLIIVKQNDHYNNDKQSASFLSTNDSSKSYSFNLMSTFHKQNNQTKLQDVASMDIHMYYSIHGTTSGFNSLTQPTLNDNFVKRGYRRLCCGL